MRPSIRFEVFRRDQFVCCYCGRRPPQVVLEVDHIVPKAAGGQDILENLTTACFECNRGKSDTQLDAPVRTSAAVDKAQELHERTLQAEAYAKMIEETQEMLAGIRDKVCEQWCFAWGGKKTETGWSLPAGVPWPKDASIRTFIKRMPLSDLFEAIDITASKLDSERGADKYFYGVCWRMIKRASGEEPEQ